MNPDFWVLRYEYSQGGVVVSSDAGKSWKMICNNAFDGQFRKETYGLAVASDGDFFTGDYSGMLAAHDGGCSWTVGDGVSDNWVSDVSIDPVDPTRVLAVTVNSGKPNGMHAYDATTQTWAALGTQVVGDSITKVIGAPSGDKVRIYQSLYRLNPDPNSTEAPAYLVRYTEDDAATWTEHAFTGELAGDLKLVAVDQTDPNRIVVAEVFSRDDPRPDRLWINEQAGDPAAYTEVASVGRFGGALFDNSGVLYFGDRKADLYRLDSADGTPAVVGDNLSPRCMHLDPVSDAFRICRVDSFGEVDLSTGAYTSILDLDKSDEDISILDCSAQGKDVVAACEAQLGNDGWCVASHWPYSHLCEAYGYPGLVELGVTPPTGGATSGTGGSVMTGGTVGADAGMGESGGAATGGTAMATGGKSTGGAATGGAAGGTGGAVAEPTKTDSGGCSMAPSSGSGRQNAAFIALSLGLLWARRRRQ